MGLLEELCSGGSLSPGSAVIDSVLLGGSYSDMSGFSFYKCSYGYYGYFLGELLVACSGSLCRYGFAGGCCQWSF